MQQVFSIVAAILMMGNVEFTEACHVVLHGVILTTSVRCRLEVIRRSEYMVLACLRIYIKLGLTGFKPSVQDVRIVQVWFGLSDTDVGHV